MISDNVPGTVGVITVFEYIFTCLAIVGALVWESATATTMLRLTDRHDVG